jgi:hypothetical protein
MCLSIPVHSSVLIGVRGRTVAVRVDVASSSPRTTRNDEDAIIRLALSHIGIPYTLIAVETEPSVPTRSSVPCFTRRTSPSSSWGRQRWRTCCSSAVREPSCRGIGQSRFARSQQSRWSCCSMASPTRRTDLHDPYAGDAARFGSTQLGRTKWHV